MQNAARTTGVCAAAGNSSVAQCASPGDGALLDATVRKVLRRLLPFLVLCYATSYLNRVNTGFAKLEMLNSLSFSETVFGLGAGLFFVGYLPAG
jgi:hypothetical protein